MRHFETSTTIEAPAERVWEVLTDTGAWPGWDSGVVRVEGEPREGRNRLDMREEFSGPLLPLIWRSMPDMSDSFRQFASGLKERAEADSEAGTS